MDLVDGRLRRQQQVGIAAGLGGDLDVAGPLQAMQFAEGVLHADATGQQTVVAQDEDVAVAQVVDQVRLFVQAGGDPTPLDVPGIDGTLE